MARTCPNRGKSVLPVRRKRLSRRKVPKPELAPKRARQQEAHDEPYDSGDQGKLDDQPDHLEDDKQDHGQHKRGDNFEISQGHLRKARQARRLAPCQSGAPELPYPSKSGLKSGTRDDQGMQFDRSLDVPAGALMRLSPFVSRLLAPNPGPFTFKGTGV